MRYGAMNRPAPDPALFQRNMEALSAVDPAAAERIGRAMPPKDTEVFLAGNGSATLVLGGLGFHSRVDPEAEAEARAGAADTVEALENRRVPVVFGFGLGHHVLALAARFDRILVVEPDPGLIRLGFGFLDFTRAMGRIVFLGPETDPEAWAPLALIPHAPTVRRHGEAYRLLAARLSGPETSVRRPDRAEAMELWSGIPGARELLADLPEGTEPDMDEWIAAVRKRRGPLTRIETYLLLIGELDPAVERPQAREET